LRASAESLARACGIGDCTHFLGWARDLVALYATMDRFERTSRNEGTPVGLIEAMAAGVPVIATSVGGVPDVVADGTDGVLVPSGSADAVARAIVRAFSEPSRTLRMARDARLTIGARYDAGRLVEEMDRLYRQQLHRKRAQPSPGSALRPEDRSCPS
jgi:glycosyltransferase involved in cell wall biosynthesis